MADPVGREQHCATKLADLDPFGIFDAEAARLSTFFSALTDADWQQPSRCVGWSVRDVLGHLAGEELYNHACLDGDIAGFSAMLRREGGGGLDDFNEWCVQQRRGRPVDEVVREWRTANSLTRRRMRALGRNAKLETSIGPYPVGLQTFHYSSEFATHADDIAAPVAAAEEPGRTQWRARVGQFVLREQGAPVQVDGVNDGYRVQLSDHIVQLSARDFVEATVGRINPRRLNPRLRNALRCLA